MKRFEFPLERVLEYRTHLQNNEKAVLSELQAQHRRLCEERDALMARLASCGRKYMGACAEGAPVKELRTYAVYIDELRKQQETQEQAIQESKARIDRQTQKVVAANRDKRGLEILKEKQTGQYLFSLRREEERSIEEFVTAAGLSVIGQ